MKLQLTYKATISGFSIIPFSIEFPTGALETTFRLSIPEDLKYGVYKIEWTAYGDYDPPLYTPIEPTTVHIIKNSKK